MNSHEAPPPAKTVSLISASGVPKGGYSGECNRTACDNRPAHFWNTSTHRFYCIHCARKINGACGERVVLLDDVGAHP